MNLLKLLFTLSFLLLPTIASLAQSPSNTGATQAADADQIPLLLSYQGLLYDNEDNAVADGSYAMTFTLYDQAESADALWSETRQVALSGGVFHVYLGSVNALMLPFDRAYWLGITVGEADELAPRTALTATPYSFMALTVADGAVTEYKLAPGAVTEPAIADSAVTATKIHPGIDITTTGTVQAGSFIGDGSGLTGLPTGEFSLPFTGEVNGEPAAFSVTNFSASNAAIGVHGQSSSTSGRGVSGWANAGSGINYGVSGVSHSTSGRGVSGSAIASSGTTYGVHGLSWSTSGYGVYGSVNASSGTNYGVYGQSSSTDGRGVYGWAPATTGSTIGVWGRSGSTSGRGVYGEADATSGINYGVYGQSSSTDGRGVYGLVSSPSGINFGVFGRSTSTSGRGVFGEATTGNGANMGVLGVSWSTSGYGVYGSANATSGTNYGVYGQSSSTDGSGVYGQANSISGTGFGVHGKSWSTSGRGVYGLASSPNGNTIGVHGVAASPNGSGVYAQTTSATGRTIAVRTAVNSPEGYSAYFTGVAGSRNYFERTVGIGTASPEAMLHLVDASSEISIMLKAGGSWNAQIQQTNNSYFNFMNGGNVRMTIRAGGQVGIGTEEPGSFRLAVNGDAAKPGGGSWSVFSDQRLKNDIQPLKHGSLDRLLQLQGYTFEYHESAIENRLALPGRQTGLIAQEVLEVFPEWVDTDDEGYLYITERGLTALLIEALRELKSEKDNEISALHQRIQHLELYLLQITSAE